MYTNVTHKSTRRTTQNHDEQNSIICFHFNNEKLIRSVYKNLKLGPSKLYVCTMNMLSAKQEVWHVEMKPTQSCGNNPILDFQALQNTHAWLQCKYNSSNTHQSFSASKMENICFRDQIRVRVNENEKSYQPRWHLSVLLWSGVS